jgi:hypothetical protein
MSQVEWGEKRGAQIRDEIGADLQHESAPLIYPAGLHARNTEARRTLAKVLEACGLSSKSAARVLHLPNEE